MKKTTITEKDIVFYKKTKAKANTKEFREALWYSRCWDKKKRNWVKHKTRHTDKILAAEEAVAFFTAHFRGEFKSLLSRGTAKGIPDVAELERVYHLVCPNKPSAASRRQNIDALCRGLSHGQKASFDPKAQPCTKILPRAFEQWFDETVAEHDDDVLKQDQTKRTRASDWRKIKSIFKKKMLSALEHQFGWPKSLVDHLRTLKDRVSTEDLSAPLDAPQYDGLEDKVKETWAAFKPWKYNDPNGYILFLLAIGGGLRFNEAIHVRWVDLRSDGVAIAKHGSYNPKGKRSRIVKIPSMIIEQIREFEPAEKKGEFGQYCISHPTPLKEVVFERKGFRPYKKVRTVGGCPCSKTERSQSEGGVARRVNRLLKKHGWEETGITSNVKKLHKLRGWVITQVAENEDIYAAQRHAGHQKIETTIAHYAGHNAKKKDYIGEGLFN